MIKITSNFNGNRLASDLNRLIRQTKFPCPNPKCKKPVVPANKKGRFVCQFCKAEIEIK